MVSLRLHANCPVCFRRGEIYIYPICEKLTFCILSSLCTYLTNCILVDSSTVICRTSPFVILGVSDFFLLLLFLFCNVYPDQTLH